MQKYCLLTFLVSFLHNLVKKARKEEIEIADVRFINVHRQYTINECHQGLLEEARHFAHQVE